MRKINNVPPGCSLQEQYYDSRGECDPGDSDEWDGNPESVFATSRAQQRQKVVQQMAHEVSAEKFHGREKQSDAPSYITKRSGFFDSETYNTVLQFEMACDMLKERMQYVRSIQTANAYLGRLTHLLDDIMADPECAPSSSTADEVVDTNVADIHDGASSSADAPDRQGDSTPSPASQVSTHSEKRFSPTCQVKNDSEESLPLRQKVLVRRGDNGQIVVVKRTILGKVRKVLSCAEVAVKEVNEPHTSTQQQYVSPHKQREEKSTPCEGASTHASSRRQQGDGPPVGALLRVLYRNNDSRYDQNVVQGIRRMAYQTLCGQGNRSTEEESGNIGPDYSSKTDEHSDTPRPRGRPRKYP